MKRLLLGVALLTWGCATGGGPKPPGPTPTPTPPSPQCQPDQACGCWYVKSGEGWVKLPDCPPDPPVVQCETLESFKVAVRIGARRIVDATPGHGFVNVNFKPLGPEASDQRTICETKAGPYTWTLDGQPCGGLDCGQSGNCFPNNNPLQIVVCRPGVAQVAGGNGVLSEPVTVP